MTTKPKEMSLLDQMDLISPPHDNYDLQELIEQEKWQEEEESAPPFIAADVEQRGLFNLEGDK